MAIKSIVDKARSQIITLYLNCPENIAFDRLKQKNLEILRGDSREFVMETDYFYFEKNNLEKPIKSEQAYLFDTANSTLRDIDKLVEYLKGKMFNQD